MSLTDHSVLTLEARQMNNNITFANDLSIFSYDLRIFSKTIKA